MLRSLNPVTFCHMLMIAMDVLEASAVDVVPLLVVTHSHVKVMGIWFHHAKLYSTITEMVSTTEHNEVISDY